MLLIDEETNLSRGILIVSTTEELRDKWCLPNTCCGKLRETKDEENPLEDSCS